MNEDEQMEVELINQRQLHSISPIRIPEPTKTASEIRSICLILNQRGEHHVYLGR
jgi:hypothetical protein